MHWLCSHVWHVCECLRVCSIDKFSPYIGNEQYNTFPRGVAETDDINRCEPTQQRCLRVFTTFKYQKVCNLFNFYFIWDLICFYINTQGGWESYTCDWLSSCLFLLYLWRQEGGILIWVCLQRAKNTGPRAQKDTQRKEGTADRALSAFWSKMHGSHNQNVEKIALCSKNTHITISLSLSFFLCVHWGDVARGG